MFTPVHDQVAVEAGRDRVEVDTLLAPLLKALWGRGMKTDASCQGDPFLYTGHVDGEGWAYIMFDDFADALEFVKTFGQHECVFGRWGNRGRVAFDPNIIDHLAGVWQ